MNWTSVTKELPDTAEGDIWLYIPEHKKIVQGCLIGELGIKYFLIGGEVYDLYEASHWKPLKLPKRPSKFKSKKDRKVICQKKYS